MTTHHPFLFRWSQVYVCTDEDNTLAELRFYCQPENRGNDQCWDQAKGPNAKALEIHVRVMLYRTKTR